MSAAAGSGHPGATRLVYVVTSPLSADLLLRGQLDFLRQAGFEITLISAPGERLEGAGRREGVDVISLPMRREISPLADLVVLWRLWRILRRLRPALVNASTPKAGLLGMLAARWARVPVRVYQLRGLRLETTGGLKRSLLVASERLAAGAAHRVVAVSASLARRFADLGLAPASKVSVLAAGSSNGVRRPAAGDGAADLRLRRSLAIPEAAPVVGFVGRFTRDKGIAELAAALDPLSDRFDGLRLLLVGDFETGDPVEPALARRLRTDPRVSITGFIADPEPYYRLMDVLAFPSRREGFPNAPLEAAMAGVPTVGCSVTGTVDAIVDGVTGYLVPAAEPPALAAAIGRYLERPALAREHGAAARRRAEVDFRPERVWRGLVELYRELLAASRTAA